MRPAGLLHVRYAMALPGMAARVDARMHAAAQVVGPVEADLDTHRHALARRFANPAIAHETAQIAIEGTENLPHRIVAPWRRARAEGGRTEPFALASGCWMAWCARTLARGERRPIHAAPRSPNRSAREGCPGREARSGRLSEPTLT